MKNIKTKKKPKFDRTTRDQLQFYVKFCSEHPVLQAKKLDWDAAKTVQDLWSELSEKLNAMKGPSRTAATWKGTLSQWKCQVRSRSRKAKAQRAAVEVPLSEFEQKALQIFGNNPAANSTEVSVLELQGSSKMPDQSSEVSSDDEDIKDSSIIATNNECPSTASTPLEAMECKVPDAALNSMPLSTLPAKPKFDRTTREQIQFFVKFCSEHPLLQAKKLDGNATKKAVQDLWSELSENLNEMHGPSRTAARWKESLSQWKYQLRSRARNAKSQSMLAAGGALSEFEQKAVQLFVDEPKGAAVSQDSTKTQDRPSEISCDDDVEDSSKVALKNECASPAGSLLEAMNGQVSSEATESTPSAAISAPGSRNKRVIVKRKFDRTTPDQIRFFVKFCSKHPELQAKKLTADASKKVVQDLWGELSKNLNAMKGPSRSAARWKNSLSQWKCQFRCRSRKANARPMLTAGAALTPDIFELKQQALQLFVEESSADTPEENALETQVSSKKQDPSSEVKSDDGNVKDASTITLNNKSLLTASTPLVAIDDQVALVAPTSTPLPSHSNSKQKQVIPKKINNSSSRRKRVTPSTIYNLMLENIKKQDENNRLVMAQQRETTAALKQLGQSLVAVSQILKKINDKLDGL